MSFLFPGCAPNQQQAARYLKYFRHAHRLFPIPTRVLYSFAIVSLRMLCGSMRIDYAIRMYGIDSIYFFPLMLSIDVSFFITPDGSTKTSYFLSVENAWLE